MLFHCGDTVTDSVTDSGADHVRRCCSKLLMGQCFIAMVSSVSELREVRVSFPVFLHASMLDNPSNGIKLMLNDLLLT